MLAEMATISWRMEPTSNYYHISNEYIIPDAAVALGSAVGKRAVGDGGARGGDKHAAAVGPRARRATLPPSPGGDGGGGELDRDRAGAEHRAPSLPDSPPATRPPPPQPRLPSAVNHHNIQPGLRCGDDGRIGRRDDPLDLGFSRRGDEVGLAALASPILVPALPPPYGPLVSRAVAPPDAAAGAPDAGGGESDRGRALRAVAAGAVFLQQHVPLR